MFIFKTLHLNFTIGIFSSCVFYNLIAAPKYFSLEFLKSLNTTVPNSFNEEIIFLFSNSFSSPVHRARSLLLPPPSRIGSAQCQFRPRSHGTASAPRRHRIPDCCVSAPPSSSRVVFQRRSYPLRKIRRQLEYCHGRVDCSSPSLPASITNGRRDILP